MAKSDNKTQDGFYPEDAQERNFDDARKTAERNHERDMATRSVGSTESDNIQVEEKGHVAVNPAVGAYGDLPKESTAPAPSNESDAVKDASAAANQDKKAE